MAATSGKEGGVVRRKPLPRKRATPRRSGRVLDAETYKDDDADPPFVVTLSVKAGVKVETLGDDAGGGEEAAE